MNVEIGAARYQLIDSISLSNDVITLKLEGGQLKITDEGQSCCESRYLTTDDDLSVKPGERLHAIELTSCDEGKLDYDEFHDIQFLEIRTSLQTLTFSSHNEHNGYYGGFCIEACFDELPGHVLVISK